MTLEDEKTIETALDLLKDYAHGSNGKRLYATTEEKQEILTMITKLYRVLNHEIWVGLT